MSSGAGAHDSGRAVRAAAGAVLALDGVAGLAAGAFGDVTTHLPGTRIRGVRTVPDDQDGADRADVHVIVYDDAELLAVAEDVRAAAAGALGCAPADVVVTVADLADRRGAAQPEPQELP